MTVHCPLNCKDSFCNICKPYYNAKLSNVSIGWIFRDPVTDRIYAKTRLVNRRTTLCVEIGSGIRSYFENDRDILSFRTSCMGV